MRVLIATVVLVLGSGLASAQVLPGGSAALGATSPLGMPGMSATATVGSPGIGLGATQLSVGGLSPAPNPLGCTTTSGVTSAGTALFDGGGTAAGATACGTLGTATASGVVTPSMTTVTGSSAGIPLGATELDNAGVSPLVTPATPVTLGAGVTASGPTSGP